MPSVSLKAHYDGERIRLDEPFDLPCNASLLVTVLEIPGRDPERSEWTAAAAKGLARAFSEDEPEYGISDIQK